LAISALLALSLVPFTLIAADPQSVVWSGKAYGPDGPWNAVELSLDGQPAISLFPGRMWNTFVTTKDYCTVNSSFAHCQSGSYDIDDADRGPSKQPVSWKPSFLSYSQTMKTTDERITLHLASVDLQSRIFGPIEDQALALIDSDSHMMEYPDGWYPVFTGCLSLGAPDRLQVFDGSGGKSINTTITPWFLKEDGKTLSSSFGLHYGSAGPSARMPGSLLFGGYDRNRLVGDVLSFPGDIHTPVNLLDISIRVIKGHSPFETLPSPTTTDSPKQPVATGLLAQGNSSITSAGLPVLLDPCSPYLTLPKSTCDAIAAHLPVTHDPALGLYLWDTSSPSYSRIVASASALSFTLMGQSNTETLTINVPFRHLNLTLSPPFTDRAVPYFPCFTGGMGVSSFGRAFFQDAFLGSNWESKTVWLAQAPGPNVPAAVNAVDVKPEDTKIESGGNDWERSWEGHWTALKAEEANGTTPVVITDTGTGPEDTGGAGDDNGGEKEAGGDSASKGDGLPVAAIAGIAVGAGLGGMAIVGVAVFFWCRRQRKKAAAAGWPVTQSDTATGPPSSWGGYPSGPYGAYGQVVPRSEMHAEEWKVHEMPGNVYEAPGDHPSPGGGNGWGPAHAR
jgi:hypothetical protein